VEQRTREHIETAEHHQQFARSLLDPRMGSMLPKVRYEWAAVAAFYAAVHYVHAYLWERRRVSPRSHPARSQRVTRDSILRQCEWQYLELLEVSLRARYSRDLDLTEAAARELVEVDLAHVETVVRAAI
jgi:hypothetical protein